MRIYCFFLWAGHCASSKIYYFKLKFSQIGWRSSPALLAMRGLGSPAPIFMHYSSCTTAAHNISLCRHRFIMLAFCLQSSSCAPQRYICYIIYKNPLRGGAPRLALHRAQLKSSGVLRLIFNCRQREFPRFCLCCRKLLILARVKFPFRQISRFSF